jgi:hypothetical protein
MDLVIFASAALAVVSIAYLAWPLLSLRHRLDRIRHAPGLLTVALLGENGERVIVTLHRGASGRFEEQEIEKFINAVAEADRAGPIAATRA